MKKYNLPEENLEGTMQQEAAAYHNAEEMEVAIKEVEAHWDDPTYWISWEDMDRRLKEKYPWLK